MSFVTNHIKLRPHSNCSVFAMMNFQCIKATCSQYSICVQKRMEKHPCAHIDLPDNKHEAKDILFCAFTLLRFCEAHCWILERFQTSVFVLSH